MNKPLWFDVGIKRYTTFCSISSPIFMLWFDVGIKRYTTFIALQSELKELWFDVGIKRYTTGNKLREDAQSCGLMQESKDIQRLRFSLIFLTVVV